MAFFIGNNLTSFDESNLLNLYANFVQLLALVDLLQFVITLLFFDHVFMIKIVTLYGLRSFEL